MPSAINRVFVHKTASAEDDGIYCLGGRDFRERRGVEYEVCASLVASGHAVWLTPTSRFFPGIKLTGKPYEETT